MKKLLTLEEYELYREYVDDYFNSQFLNEDNKNNNVDKNKVKIFLKKHWKKILLGAGLISLGIGTYFLFIKKNKNKIKLDVGNTSKNIVPSTNTVPDDVKKDLEKLNTNESTKKAIVTIIDNVNKNKQPLKQFNQQKRKQTEEEMVAIKKAQDNLFKNRKKGPVKHNIDSYEDIVNAQNNLFKNRKNKKPKKQNINTDNYYVPDLKDSNKTISKTEKLKIMKKQGIDPNFLDDFEISGLMKAKDKSTFMNYLLAIKIAYNEKFNKDNNFDFDNLF